MNTKEKIAYLSGLMAGYGYGEDTKEGKVFGAIVDVLGSIADELNELEAEIEELDDFVDDLADDIDDLDDRLEHLSQNSDNDDEDILYDIQCPECGHVTDFDPEQLWETDDLHEFELVCENCGTIIFSGAEFFADDDDDEDDLDDEDKKVQFSLFTQSLVFDDDDDDDDDLDVDDDESPF